MNIKKMLLESLAEHMVDAVKERKVLKSFPLRPEWKKIHVQLTKLTEEAQSLEHKRDSVRKKLWSTIEEGLNIYDKSLHINTETNEVEVLGE